MAEWDSEEYTWDDPSLTWDGRKITPWIPTAQQEEPPDEWREVTDESV